MTISGLPAFNVTGVVMDNRLVLVLTGGGGGSVIARVANNGSRLRGTVEGEVGGSEFRGRLFANRGTGTGGGDNGGGTGGGDNGGGTGGGDNGGGTGGGDNGGGTGGGGDNGGGTGGGGTDGGPTVTGLTLINAATDTPINALEDEAILEPGLTGAQGVDIRADVSGTVGSVVFGYDDNPRFRVENFAPYSIGGDENGDFAPFALGQGPHTLTATPYSGPNGTGTAGQPVTVDFTVPVITIPGAPIVPPADGDGDGDNT
jgi:hypothetical protein